MSAGRNVKTNGEIGPNIKLIRESRNVERADLAKLAKISYSHLSDIESGRTDPSIRVAFRIAECLNCTLDDLKGGNGNGRGGCNKQLE